MVAPHETLGELTSTARLAENLGLRKLARRVGTIPSYSSEIKNDRRVSSEDVLDLFARRMDFRVDELELELELELGVGRVGKAVHRLVDNSPEAARRLRAKPFNDTELRRLGKSVERKAKHNTTTPIGSVREERT